MQTELKSDLKNKQLLFSEVKCRDYISLNITYHTGKTNIKHLSFHCSQVAHLSLLVSRGCNDRVMGGHLGQEGGSYLQDAYGLEASEGSLGDVADGVVAQTESVEIPEHSQTAFIQTSQVFVRQIQFPQLLAGEGLLS